MGSSFVRYKNKGYWARDGALEVWLHLLAEKTKRLPPAETWLVQLGDHWHVQSSVGFIGCIEVGLDEYVSDENRRQIVASLCHSVLDDLKRGALLLTKDRLNALGVGGKGSVFIGDVPAEVFIKQGEAFAALLQESHDK